MVEGILKWFMMAALRLGVRLKSDELVITTPTCLGWTPALLRQLRTTSKATDSNSWRHDAIVSVIGTWVKEGGA